MTTWRKATASKDDNCVEMADLGDSVGLRDSKLGDDSPVLHLSRAAFADLLDQVRAGDLDHLA